MDPARKRQTRLVVALCAAVLLAVALIYTSFSASTEARQPSELLNRTATGTYDLTGKVVKGTLERDGSTLSFEVSDRDGGAGLPVRYTGQVPDPFREGREIILTGSLVDGTFVAEKDSLITKCPSKFSEAAEDDPQIVIIED